MIDKILKKLSDIGKEKLLKQQERTKAKFDNMNQRYYKALHDLNFKRYERAKSKKFILLEEPDRMTKDYRKYKLLVNFSEELYRDCFDLHALELLINQRTFEPFKFNRFNQQLNKFLIQSRMLFN